MRTLDKQRLVRRLSAVERRTLRATLARLRDVFAIRPLARPFGMLIEGEHDHRLIYNNPTWLWGTVLVALFTATSCGGLLVFHRLVHVNVRRARNDLAGFTIAVIGVLYAVPSAWLPRSFLGGS